MVHTKIYREVLGHILMVYLLRFRLSMEDFQFHGEALVVEVYHTVNKCFCIYNVDEGFFVFAGVDWKEFGEASVQ